MTALTPSGMCSGPTPKCDKSNGIQINQESPYVSRKKFTGRTIRVVFFIANLSTHWVSPSVDWETYRITRIQWSLQLPERIGIRYNPRMRKGLLALKVEDGKK